MGVSINNTISQISNLVDVDVSPLSNGDALIYVSATGDWTATALPGGGDMLKATYDTDLDGVVDTAHDVSATPLITRSSVASQGGLLINIDSATGDIARTTNGFLENNTNMPYVDFNGATGSCKVTASKKIELSITVNGSNYPKVGQLLTSATLAGNNLSFLIPVKSSTKYKARIPVTGTITGDGVYVSYMEYNSAGSRVVNGASARGVYTGTIDQYMVYEFTTSATSILLYLAPSFWNAVTGTITVDWNNMTLEEVVEPVANSLTSSSPSLVSVQAVGSTDNIDQSQLTATANYPLGDLSVVYFGQQFLPRKSKLTGVVIQKHATTGSYTGNITVAIVNDNAGVPGSTILATSTIANATWTALTVGVDYTVNLPCNLTVDGSTKYWIRLFSSTSSATDYARIKAVNPTGYADGGIAYGVDGVTYPVTSTNDLYFKTLYYKPTTNFKASQNNSTVSISADEDGIIDGAIINRVNGTYSFAKTYINNIPELAKNDNYSFSNNGGGLLDAPTAGIGISSTLGVTNLVYKINTVLPMSNVVLSVVGNIAAGRDFKVQYSPDNGVTPYVDIRQYTNADTLATVLSSIPSDGLTVFYLRFVNGTNICYLRNFGITANLDASSLSTLRNYPTNKDVVTTYNKSLNTATTTATYRATAWGFPAIEYSATEYQFLDVDTTATGSTVAFSADGVSYTTVADGANIALSSTTTPLVWVKTNITANRLYLSSNDYNASGDKDGSNKMTVGYQVASQGLTYTVDELLSEVNELKAAVYALQNP